MNRGLAVWRGSLFDMEKKMEDGKKAVLAAMDAAEAREREALAFNEAIARQPVTIGGVTYTLSDYPPGFIKWMKEDDEDEVWPKTPEGFAAYIEDLGITPDRAPVETVMLNYHGASYHVRRDKDCSLPVGDVGVALAGFTARFQFDRSADDGLAWFVNADRAELDRPDEKATWAYRNCEGNFYLHVEPQSGWGDYALFITFLYGPDYERYVERFGE